MVVRRFWRSVVRQVRTAFKERWLDIIILGLYLIALAVIYNRT